MTPTLPGPEPIVSGADLRLFPRRRPRSSAAVRPANKPMAMLTRVKLTDISHGGVGFTGSARLELGQVIVIELQQTAGSSKPHSLEATVRWVGVERNTGMFRIGCAWSQRLNFFDLQRYS